MGFFHHAGKHKSYAIIGLGRFGTALAIELCRSGEEILVLDSDEERVNELREYTENAFVVQHIDKKSLMETGVQNCDVAIVCIGSKMDISILATLHLTALEVPRVIAKATSAEHGDILERLGAEVVYPERDMAVRLAKRLVSSKILNYIELSEKIDISKIVVPGAFVDQRIIDVNLRKKYGLNIIAIEHGEEIITNVAPEYRFARGDVIYVIGNKVEFGEFEDALL